MISLPLSILWLITLLGETEPHFFGTSMKDRLEIGSIPIREKNLEATAMVPKLPYGPPYNNQRTFVQDTEVCPSFCHDWRKQFASIIVFF